MLPHHAARWRPSSTTHAPQSNIPAEHAKRLLISQEADFAARGYGDESTGAATGAKPEEGGAGVASADAGPTTAADGRKQKQNPEEHPVAQHRPAKQRRK
jgi:hypothetical protein